MKQLKKKKNTILIETFDALFIMLLCFGTLLSAMLMKGNSEGGISYIIDFKTIVITIAVIIVYLFFVVKQSDKELKIMISKLFNK
ncbi:MAG: hypothetical protein K0Q97_2946 [Bacillota bacterium]|jgi:uncharacterized membrane-anchored protein|nr:hypothetical protein [Bacillota bacterium]